MKERTVLLVAYDYPPANTPGATRVARIARHLPAMGWQPIVLTTTSAGGAASDDEDRDRVVRVRGLDTKHSLSIAGRYPAILAFPDRYVGSLPAAVRRGRHLLRARRIDAICSTSPPVTTHLIARALRSLAPTPWIAELRDPWNLGAPFGPTLRRFDRYLERRLLRAADRVIVTTDQLADDLRDDLDPRRLRLVPNGFDEGDFACPAPAADDSFVVLHAGHIGGSYRNPAELLRALRLCLDTGTLPPETRVRFLGVAAGAEKDLAALARELGLAGCLDITARVTSAAAIAAMRAASLLVVLQEKESFSRSLPSKSWEYLRSGRAILVIAPEGSATHQTLGAMPGVWLAPENRAAALAPVLAAAHAAWRDGSGRSFARNLDAWRAENIAATFAAVLDEVAHGA